MCSGSVRFLPDPDLSGQEIYIFGFEVPQPILNDAQTDPEHRGEHKNFILKGILARFAFNQAFAPCSGLKIRARES